MERREQFSLVRMMYIGSIHEIHCLLLRQVIFKVSSRSLTSISTLSSHLAFSMPHIAWLTSSRGWVDKS